MRHYAVVLDSGAVVSLPSVTAVLSATMPHDRRSRFDQKLAANPRQAMKRRDDGRARGSGVHDYAAAFLRGQRPLPGHQWGPWVRHLTPLLQQIVDEPGQQLHVEQQVYSLEHRYAGTFDLLCRWPNHGLVLADFKTAGKVYPDAVSEAGLQLAAYRMAWNEMTEWMMEPTSIAACFVTRSRLDIHWWTGRDLDGLHREWLRRRRSYGSTLEAE